MNTMKRLLPTPKGIISLFVILIMGMGTTFAADFSAVCSTGQTLYYNITNPTLHYVELTYPGTDTNHPWNGYTRPVGNITLPSTVTYNGITYTVTKIGNHAFDLCDGLTGSLSIPNTVTVIGYSAFAACTGFTGSLTIPNSVTTIGSSAFDGCVQFSGPLVIPNSVNTIGAWAFASCEGFTSLTIGDSVTTIGEGAFKHCSGLTGSLVIPNSVTIIGREAFYMCPFSGTLSIGSSVTTIEEYAFFYCQGLTGPLVIPNGVTSIGKDAFHYCEGFTGLLSLPESLSSIGSSAFFNCSGFEVIWALREFPPTLGTGAFDGVPETIPVHVSCSAIDAYLADEGWSYFTNIQCPPSWVSVTVIPEEAGTVTGGGFCAHGATCTLTATPNGNALFLYWKKDGAIVSYNSSYSFVVNEDVDLEAVFMLMSDDSTVVGTGETSNVFLPSYSYYNYNLTQQIYTFSELDGSNPVMSISFFNTGAEKTRNYDIYMVHTTKTNFNSDTDWITVTSADRVFRGNVTFKQNVWTTIWLNSIFLYNGTSNLALIIDDNTGDYSEGMSCCVYNAPNQAIHVYSDEVNYDPLNPTSYSGSARMNYKNQIIFNRWTYDIAVASANASQGTVTGGGEFGHGDFCSVTATANSGYVFLDWTDERGVVVSSEASYTFPVLENKTLTANFIPDGDLCMIDFNLHDSYGDGWDGNYLVVNFGDGTTQQLEVPTNKSSATFSLPVADRSHIALSWIEANYASECSFEVVYADGNLIYEGQNLSNSFSYEFNVSCEGVISQSIALASGWNWVSFNVEITLDHLKAAVKAANPGARTIIKSKSNGQTMNTSGNNWTTQLSALDLSQMYEIKVANACTITVEGQPINPADHPATIHKGANWIAYPLNVIMLPKDAFNGFAERTDKVKSKNDGEATCINPSNGNWTGGLSSAGLKPGNGYIYTSKASGDKTFVFP